MNTSRRSAKPSPSKPTTSGRQSITTFGAIVATLDGVVVPQPVMEPCRSDLLVMDRLDGVVLKDASRP